jgi:subtilisin family serine protease
MSKRPRKLFRRARLRLEELEAREVPSTSPAGSAIDSGSYSSNDILVRWQNNAPVSTPLSTGYQALGNDTYDVKLAPGTTVSQAVAYYSKLAGVVFAQPDYTLSAAMVPNDTYISYQWGLNAVGAETAWNYTTGGSPITVAVIDTGVFADTDLAPNLIPGYNFVTDTTNTSDQNGHGTVVAGILGAVGNNKTGVAGIDWNVKIMPLTFMDASGSGYLSDAVSAINYAVANGAKIINASWGGGGYDAALAAAIQNAQAHGVIFVAAAGNNSSDNDTTPEYPASYSYSNVVSVAATDSNNNLASFSDFGKSVTLAAPGVSILSTTPGNTYEYYSGTSMAAPFVTGALALVWSIHPTWTYNQVIADVVNNTDHPASLTGKVEYGLLDVGKAVAAAEPPPTTPTAPAPVTTPSTGVTTFSSGTVNVGFSGKQTVTSSLTVNQHITIGSLTANLNIQNLTDSAIEVTLISPTGQQVLIFNRRGGSGANLTNTTFSNTAPNAIYLAQAPFSEAVRPEYSLAAFANEDAFGTWKLQVTSIVSTDSGKIINWSIAITPAATAAKTASVGAGVEVGGEAGGTGADGGAAVAWINVQAPATATNNGNESSRPANSQTPETNAANVVPVATNASTNSNDTADAGSDDSIDRLIASLFVQV